MNTVSTFYRPSVFQKITRPESEKAPIAEFLNPAAYRLRPEGEAPRFFIPASIYSFLLKKTQSLITRLGKMEDTILELGRNKEQLTRANDILVGKLRARDTSRSFQIAKIKDKDAQIERLESALEFEKQLKVEYDRQLKDDKLEIKALHAKILSQSVAPVQSVYSAQLPSVLEGTIERQSHRIRTLEAQLEAVRCAIAPPRFIGAPFFPSLSSTPSVGSIPAPKADPFKGILNGVNAGIEGLKITNGTITDASPTQITNGIVADVKPPVEGYARSISNGIKAGDTSRFARRSNVIDNGVLSNW